MSDLREAHRMLDALLNPAHGWENCGTDVTRVIQRWRRNGVAYMRSIGVYGLMAYSVQQRTQEIGIRMALGAEAAEVRRMVVLQGMTFSLIGIAVGASAAFGLARFMSSFLFGVQPWDPAVFMTVPVLLALIALVAVFIPAMRATQVDPMAALRYE